MNLHEFLGAETIDDGMSFEIGREMHGAFDGAFGGVVAACSLVAARTLGEGRRPISLDCRFLKSIPAGKVEAVPTVVRSGRTVTVVSVALTDSTDELAAVAVASFANPVALHPFDDASMVRPGASIEYHDASPWTLKRSNAPIVNLLSPHIAMTQPGLIATVFKIPWDEGGTGPEAACMAADMAVGPPVAAELGADWVPHPNPDLSMRFAVQETGPEVAGVARLERVAAGVAPVRIEVFSGLDLIAVGVSCSLLLGFGVLGSKPEETES